MQDGGVSRTACAVRLLHRSQCQPVLFAAFGKVSQISIHQRQIVPSGGTKTWIRRRVLGAQRQLIRISGIPVATGLSQAVAFLRMPLPSRLLGESYRHKPEQTGTPHYGSSPVACAGHPAESWL